MQQGTPTMHQMLLMRLQHLTEVRFVHYTAKKRAWVSKTPLLYAIPCFEEVVACQELHSSKLSQHATSVCTTVCVHAE